ncbi:hypothetical protein EG850_12320 [Gulosibacter macacae]|uniref:Uncharacterized protein n=1 Tax=Gulosibacter macacae TaxID=2488791 RepID=A0A3P3VSD3_9MICO|nr:hypothetical protein [Gulosibacter macacae]RRJ85701.1 hypothetical protein EG850_12320 [Gulosibacter macacae]
MPTSSERPEWLTEPCPIWRDGRHDDQEMTEDRRHHSEYQVVPVIQRQVRWPRGTRGAGDEVEGDELNVLAFRDVGARETWIAIANDRQHVEVTLESALRLHAALGDMLDQIPNCDT